MVVPINDDLEKLKSIIQKRQSLNGNMCGTTIISLMDDMKIELSDIIILLKKLHEKKFIKVRKGVNQKLIFLTR